MRTTLAGRERLRFGLDGREGNRCADCGVRRGELHWWYCDQETCPACGGQLMSCCVHDCPTGEAMYADEVVKREARELGVLR